MRAKLTDLKGFFDKNPSEDGAKCSLLCDILISTTKLRLIDLEPQLAHSLMTMTNELVEEFF